MSVSTYREKKYRVIQVMKDKSMSTNYTILLSHITAEAAIEAFHFLPIINF